MRVVMALAMLALVGCATPREAACDLTQADAPCARAWIDAHLRANDIQAIGTHNSYRIAIGAAEFATIAQRSPFQARALDYAHDPLTQQLDAGARQIELDTLIDREGGRYAHPRARALLSAQGATLEPFDNSALLAPGFKVMHAQDIDYRSVCQPFVACLREILAWSNAHRDHAPILIMLNLKYGASDVPGGVEAPDYDAAAFDALDAEIRSVIPEDGLITPDRVQRGYASLRDAIAADAWPTLGEARGHFIFAIDADYRYGEIYRGARANLEGRVMFPNQPESSPIAAYMTLNDPIGEAARIRAAVAANLIVRTRADADTWEARRGDSARRDAAFASGAQYVSTDYMTPRTEWSSYSATLPEIARCNPVRAENRCGANAVEGR